MDGKKYKRQYGKETYEFRKAHNICARCGAEDAEPGITFCLVCKMDERERSLNYYYNMSEEKKNTMLARKKSKYDDRRSNGLCVRCGTPADGKTLCQAHRETDKWYRHRRYLKMQALAAEVE